MSPTFRVLDSETTGFDPETEAVVELAAVDVQDGAIVDVKSDLVDPGIPVPPEASAVHHLTSKDLDGYPPLSEVWPQYKPGEGVIMVAHNASFDVSFLGQAPNEWLCTYRLASHLWPDAPGHSNQVLRYWLELSVPGADGLAAHRALADAYVTAAILGPLLEAAREAGLSTVADLRRRCWEPIIQTKCRFGKHRGKPWTEVPRDYLQWMVKQGAQSWDADTWATIHHYLGG